MKSREVINRIESLGGEFVRQRGSHRRYRIKGRDTTAFTTVQVHKGREIPLGTLKSIEADLAPVLGKGWLL